MSVTSWLRNRKARPIRRPAFRPRLESLEDRATPSAGALDPTFGTGGATTTFFPSFYSTPRNGIQDATYFGGSHETAIQADGKIIQVGWSFQNGPNVTNHEFDFAITRYTVSGAVDTSFGASGSTPGFVGFDFATASTICTPTLRQRWRCSLTARSS